MESTAVESFDIDREIDRLLLSGEAKTIDEAEERALNAAHPEILRLLEADIDSEELANHPLFMLLRFRGSRRREDSLW